MIHTRTPAPGLDRETGLVAAEIGRLAAAVSSLVASGNQRPRAARNTARDLAKMATALASLTQRALELDDAAKDAELVAAHEAAV